jgi:hypothetical protein
MKRTSCKGEILLHLECPYCDTDFSIDLSDLEKMNTDNLEIHPIETVLRGFYKKFSTSEGFINELSIKCIHCAKNFVVTELDY